MQHIADCGFDAAVDDAVVGWVVADVYSEAVQHSSAVDSTADFLFGSDRLHTQVQANAAGYQLHFFEVV